MLVVVFFHLMGVDCEHTLQTEGVQRLLHQSTALGTHREFEFCLIWLPPIYLLPVLAPSSYVAFLSKFSDKCCDF